MLCPPGQADDRKAKQDTEDKMGDGKPESRDEQPDKVEQQGEAAREFIVDLKGTSEGPQAKETDLDQLESEGDANDGEHHHESTPYVADRGGKTTEDQPDDIAEEVHVRNIGIESEKGL